MVESSSQCVVVSGVQPFGEKCAVCGSMMRAVNGTRCGHQVVVFCSVLCVVMISV